MAGTDNTELRQRFQSLWQELSPIGRAADGGYFRLAWSRAELDCRDWFRSQAEARGLQLDEDRNGNIWAWWGPSGPGAVATGSHLDSVPGGGAFDGPLGVVSALMAVDLLKERGVRPMVPVVVAAMSDEEGGRFGVACAGSRLMTGSAEPKTLLQRRDADGVTMEDAMRSAGFDPGGCGEDGERLRQLGTFVELHIEQGRAMVDMGLPVTVAGAVWPHGRWRIDYGGRGDHAGTTRIQDRHDPLLPLARTILSARTLAAEAEALATVGKVSVRPGAVNAIASSATAWLDARAPTETAVKEVVERVGEAAAGSGVEHGVEVEVTEESWSGGVDFGAGLRDRLSAVVEDELGCVGQLPTGAGHDAAVLAARVPAAMLFVRNPTGVSHDPSEHASEPDCLAGILALTAVLGDLVSGKEESCQ